MAEQNQVAQLHQELLDDWVETQGGEPTLEVATTLMVSAQLVRYAANFTETLRDLKGMTDQLQGVDVRLDRMEAKLDRLTRTVQQLPMTGRQALPK